MSEKKIYNIDEVMKMLPHRYPFLLVDRLEVEEPGVKGVGIKNLTRTMPIKNAAFCLWLLTA